MIIQAVALSWALLLSQVEGQKSAPPSRASSQEENPDGNPVNLRNPGDAQAPSQGSAPTLSHSDLTGLLTPEEPRPSLRYDQPILCTRLPSTKQVPTGEYRMQCDPVTRRCLIAPANELDSSGEETDRPLLRTSYCDRSEVSAEARIQEGYRFVPAIAESPPGWYRDEQGRVMQFNFDLHRRMYVGGAWAPLKRNGGDVVTDRIRVDFGIQTETPGGADDHRLHRFTFLETEAYVGESSLDVTLLRYDFNVERKVPLFRITTFFGEPRRFDVGLNLGAWVEVLHQESIEREDSELSLLTWGAVHGTLDLWHSEDLVSFVRLRAGPGLERDRTHAMNTLVPTAALEGDFSLDADGFHHLLFSAEAEEVLMADRVEGRPLRPQRLKARAGYELILLAINDQPLSLVVDARGVWRSDIPHVDAKWEWSANAGLRVSLWAPARRSAPLASAR
ncbi:hypothetical protein [Hyalangium versicolor]|uniref:hypothetical protein n=1 Tax=Hyalangium versicolor TaxID=2861190 RepID=UPI001CCF0F5E|nr:hypothetical protein [Hyalangium versicolor]